MKINLLLNAPNDTRSGYMNIDPTTPDGDATRIRCQLDKLDMFVDANEVSEIVAMDILDTFGPDDIDRVLDHWVSRLAHQGTISLSVLDAREVSRALMSDTLPVTEFSDLVHGQRKTSLTMKLLADALESRGLKITKKRNVHYRAVIVAQRP